MVKERCPVIGAVECVIFGHVRKLDSNSALEEGFQFSTYFCDTSNRESVKSRFLICMGQPSQSPDLSINGPRPQS